ncbi:peptidogalycan biosysnthesis protein [Sphingomonas sp. MMS24-JH45]
MGAIGAVPRTCPSCIRALLLSGDRGGDRARPLASGRGAQGEHKLARDEDADLVGTFIPDANFRRAIADFLVRERAAVEGEQAFLAQLAPFRRG